MKKPFEQFVYIIGADHHTTLALLRDFGRIGCNIRLVIHGKSDRGECKLSSSKYAKEVFRVEENESALLKCLLGQMHPEKGLILPASDFSALVIDKNYFALKDKYHIPGFRNNPGRVVELMNKFAQAQYAEEMGIPMAKSWMLNPEVGAGYEVPNDIEYPCIIKPLISAYGSKENIYVAWNKDELINCLSKAKGQLLAQRFLEKKYETCAYGVLTDSISSSVGIVIKKLHETKNGSTIWGQVIENENSNQFAEHVCELLWQQGYRGLYDFEMIVCTDGVYLNEINFRNSGNAYALSEFDIPAGILWCLSVLGQESPKVCNKSHSGKLHIQDIYELTHAPYIGINRIQAIVNIFRTKNRAIWDWMDLRVSVVFYWSIVKRYLTRKMRG